MKIKFIILLACTILAGCSTAGPLKVEDYNIENITIRTTVVPDAEKWKRATTQWALGDITPLIPAFDGKGLLMASWTPSKNPDAPTFVIAHGGGGIGPMLLFMGADLRALTDANILILDSIWSRGRISNGGDSIQRSGYTLSSNARMFDLVAAGKWLATQGIDPKKTYAIGESQGGWGVLRAFTDDPTIAKLVKPYYAGAVALYPQCGKIETNVFVYHQLGPYHSRVLLITGGRDTLTPVAGCSDVSVKSTERWIHWEDATHAFNIGTHGLFKRPVDGVCKTITNSLGTHPFCYNERRTNEMLTEIKNFAGIDK